MKEDRGIYELQFTISDWELADFLQKDATVTKEVGGIYGLRFTIYDCGRKPTTNGTGIHRICLPLIDADER